MKLSRRGFLFGASAVAGGMVLLPGQGVTLTSIEAMPEVTAWIVILPDDTTIIRVARTDMGQGIFTALPMLVAEELECDWSKVQAEYADTNRNVTTGQPFGNMVTSTSISIRDSHEYLRMAGAQARSMLIAEAAEQWGLPVGECEARNGVVRHSTSGQSIRFGKIAEAAAQRPMPETVSLKTPDQWRLIGTRVPRHDAKPKVSGAAIFASDMNLPGMLHAAVLACPSHGGTLVRFDPAPVLAMPGVVHVLQVDETAVAVVALSWWQAKKALDQLSVEWDISAAVGASTDLMRDQFRTGLDAEDIATGHSIGDVESALTDASQILEAEYEVPHLAHATMEPQTCTALVTADRAAVWVPT